MSALRSARARRGFPLGRNDAARFLPWALGLMAYAAVLSAVGLILFNASLSAAQRTLATTLSLQVPADASPARLRTVLAVLRQTPGIASVRLLDDAETARLLAPWLGSAVPLAKLPVPRLIDVRADPARRIDFATLHRELASVVPGARLEDHRRLLPAMRAGAARIDALLGAAIAAALALIAAAAWFAVRAGLVAERPLVELLHLLGAADRAIARRVALRGLWLGASGGLIGAVAAFLTIFALGGTGSVVPLPAPATADQLGDWRLWVVMIGIVPAAGLIAMASAGIAVLRRLARMP